MTVSRKPAAWIQNAVREGKKPVVWQNHGEWLNLSLKKAAYLNGDYMVTEKEHEIIVDLNSQRKNQ